MATQNKSPFLCHIFVCTNDRKGERESCADGDSPSLRAALKQEIEARGLKPRVRLSSSGCLGLCAQGPNVMLYPQGVWLARATTADVDEILDRVSAFIEGER